MADYQIIVKDKNGTQQGEFDVFRGLSFSKKLNNYGECRFEVPIGDDKLNSLTALRTYETYVYRNGTLVWGGEMAIRRGELTQGGNDWAEITSYGFFEMLNHRYTDSSRIFDGVDAGTIAWTLIDESQTGTNADLGITQGTIEATKNRERVYYNDNIMEEIIRLSEVNDGFDFEIDDEKEFNVYSQKGRDLSDSVVFEYGTNFLRVSILEDFTRPTNRAIVLGEGFENNQLREERNNTSLQSVHKIREFLANEITVSEQATLQDKGDAILRKYKQPIINIDMTQMPKTVPTFGTLVMGDRCKLRIDKGVYNIDNDFRIYGYAVDLTDDNEELISYEMGLL